MQAKTINLELAKNVFQVHRITDSDELVLILPFGAQR